jgi:hypothetical protein
MVHRLFDEWVSLRHWDGVIPNRALNARLNWLASLKPQARAMAVILVVDWRR